MSTQEVDMNENFLMTQDAARVLGKSPETVRGYERTGKLTAIRTVSGRRLFKESDVKALAAKLSEQPNSDPA
jgi:DNA-binding transcriptional MerR regulator